MRACVLHAIGDLRFEEVPAPIRKPGEALMRVKASGVCGSDVPRVFEKGTYHFPTIPGHEFAGEIIEADDPILIGRRAAVFPLLPCRECAACEMGVYAQCERYNYFGSRCDGAFAEYISVPVWNLVPMPEGLSWDEAAMCEPAAVAVHALRQARIDIGDTVAVFGAGSIGLMLAQWAVAWGAQRAILIDIDESKLAFARNLGWSHCINSTREDPTEIIRRLTDGRGADVAVEGAGVSQTLEQCLKSVKTFGRIIAMGNPADDIHISQKAYWEILRKQITLKGTWNSSYNSQKNDWQTALLGMEKGWIKPTDLITHRFALSECTEAFGMMRDKKIFFNKVMFTP